MDSDLSRKRLVFSCAFGTKFGGFYPAIPGFDGVLFSNNRSLEKLVEERGWKFRLVRKHKLSDDFRISSIQSKYIKFLQFFDEFPEFLNYEEYLYFDHKFEVKKEHINFIDSSIQDETSIFIRNTPRLKLSIEDEIQDAMGQERYVITMPQTIEWINTIVSERNLSKKNRIMNTGLMYYKNLQMIMPLLDEVYETVWRLAQPECQIIWALLSQEYDHLIQRAEWSELNPFWMAPD